MSRAPALEWFILCWLGAYFGATVANQAPVVLLLASAAVLATASFWLLRSYLWPHAPRIARGLLGVALATCIMASAAQRVQEFEKWEQGLTRGSVETIVGPVVDVRPYWDGRLAIGIGLDPVGDARTGWRLRVISEVEPLLAVLRKDPVDDNGFVQLPARMVPFCLPVTRANSTDGCGRKRKGTSLPDIWSHHQTIHSIWRGDKLRLLIFAPPGPKLPPVYSGRSAELMN